MRNDDVVTGILVVMAGIAVGIAVGAMIDSHIWERRAIQHKAAYYDQVTGEFQWNEVIQEAKR